MLLALLGCAAPVADPNPATCDARALEPGEVRARRIPCSAERATDGDGRAGDWVIENSQSRWFVRDAFGPLTRLDGAGGTLVDVVGADGVDGLLELSPTLSGQTPASLEITAWSDDTSAGLDLVGALPDGGPVALRYRLDADAATLRVEGADGALLAPLEGAALLGESVEIDEDHLLGVPGVASDRGGWIDWALPDTPWEISWGARDEVYAALHPDGLEVSGAAEGDWVEALVGGEAVARLPVADGVFAGRVPAHTEGLITTAEGYGATDPVEPGRGLTLALGAPGSVAIRAADEDGRALPTTLWWDGQPWPVPADGARILVGPAPAAAVLSAGPAYERAELGEITPDETTAREVVLRRAVPEGLRLLDPALRAWPDPAVREPTADRLRAADAAGIDYALLMAEAEVAVVDADPRARTLAQAGSRLVGDDGAEVLAWPWTSDGRFPAHGAVHTAGLAPLDLLAAAQSATSRLSAVDAAWVRQAPAPLGWDPLPRALRMGGLDDLDALITALDAGIVLSPVGPLAWLEDVPELASVVDLDAALVEGRAVATNGPYVRLRVEGQGPGALVDRAGRLSARVQVWAPEWAPLATATLRTTGGEVLASWPVPPGSGLRLDRVALIAPGDWVVATVEGDEAAPPTLVEPAWAVTGPIWISP